MLSAAGKKFHMFGAAKPQAARSFVLPANAVSKNAKSILTSERRLVRLANSAVLIVPVLSLELCELRALILGV